MERSGTMLERPGPAGPRTTGAPTDASPEDAAPEDHASLAARPGERAPLRADEIGPLCRLLGQVFMVGALIYLFGAYALRPAVATLLLAPALGCVLLAPRAVLMRARVSIPILAVLTWMALSWVWSASRAETAFELRVGLPLLLAAMVVTGILSTRDLVQAALAAVRLVVLIAIVALVVDPASRSETNPGWHGSFLHKNTMAVFMVFALATTLGLDRGWRRWLTALTTGVLIVGSQSATGLSGALVVLAVYTWLHLFRRASGPGSSTATAAATIGLVVVGAAGVLANLSSVFGAYGKDVTLTGRTTIWSAVIGAIESRPLTGYGLGAVLRVNDPSPITLELWEEIGDQAAHAHNGVLDLTAQLGFVGMVLYLVVFVTTLAMAVALVRRRPDMATWALLVMAGQAVMSLSEPVLLGPWLLVAAMIRAPLMRVRHLRSRDPGNRGPSLPDHRRPQAPDAASALRPAPR